MREEMIRVWDAGTGSANCMFTGSGEAAGTRSPVLTFEEKDKGGGGRPRFFITPASPYTGVLPFPFRVVRWWSRPSPRNKMAIYL